MHHGTGFILERIVLYATLFQRHLDDFKNRICQRPENLIPRTFLYGKIPKRIESDIKFEDALQLIENAKKGPFIQQKFGMSEVYFKQPLLVREVILRCIPNN